jgi:hypothetical protein
MKWEKIQRILIEYGYTNDSIKKIKEAKQLPTALKLFELRDRGIPIKAWEPFIQRYKERKVKNDN